MTEQTIESLLEKFKPLGTIHLHMHDDFTYSANLKLFIKTQGVNFDIESGYKNKTPLSALQVVDRKLSEVMSAFSVNKKLTE